MEIRIRRPGTLIGDSILKDEGCIWDSNDVVYMTPKAWSEFEHDKDITDRSHLAPNTLK